MLHLAATNIVFKMLESCLYILFAYLIGSIPVGVILARIKGVDPRRVGSSNIGATNVARAAGKTVGILTLVGDIMKGLLPVVYVIHSGQPPSVIALSGMAVFLGHIFPLYLGFKGGKGVATAVGVYLAIEPMAVFIALIVFIIVFIIWRYVSLSSLLAATSMPFIMLALNSEPQYIYLTCVVVILIIIKHRENIKRLKNRTEQKFR